MSVGINHTKFLQTFCILDESGVSILSPVLKCCGVSLLLGGVLVKVWRCFGEGEMTRHDLPGNQCRETSVIWFHVDNHCSR